MFNYSSIILSKLFGLILSVPFINVSIFPWIPYSFDYTEFKERQTDKWNTQNGYIISIEKNRFLHFIFKNLSTYYSSCFFHMNFGIMLSIDTKTFVENLIGIVFKWYINLERTNVLLFESYFMSIACLRFCSLGLTSSVPVY